MIEYLKSGHTNLTKILNNPDKFIDADNVIDNIAKLNPIALFFQTGYLTIKESFPIQDGDFEYTLGLPNLEVKASLVPLALSIKPPRSAVLAKKQAERTRDCLLDMDREGLENALGGYLAQYSYDIHIEDERFYHALFQSAIMMVGQKCYPQEHTSHGRIDIELQDKNSVYIIELKLYKDGDRPNISPTPPKKPEDVTKLRSAMAPLAKEALNQIDQKYAQTFYGTERIVKVAIVFARRTYVLAEFETCDFSGSCPALWYRKCRFTLSRANPTFSRLTEVPRAKGCPWTVRGTNCLPEATF
jgi:hypothetical protein